ncbi:hypothetical protein [Cohnella abietis]|uniref:Uncharacterized protein n=1 Tax=Cohnella abietis TaxID=2507935 RepID=A0A3T1D7W2_9BACL|nr:hypothetical protein [Cohnella abietis]BBI34158.1 hypothetical protein KCTCHS21_35570 [Cohnella abietis]
MNNSRRGTASLIAIIIILMVLLGFCINSKVSSDNKAEAIQDRIDKTFVYQLGEAASSFGRDLSNDDNSDYENCVASVAAASSVANLSSYEDDNDLIDLALDSLYRAMLNSDKKENVIHNAVTIREIFVKLNVNPADTEATSELSKVIDSL